MLRNIGTVCVIFLAIILAGCATASKSIVAKQNWSENYARMKGVEATSPAMVDGDPGTIAETRVPADASSATKYTEAVVKLPEKKAIRKIVINSANLRSFAVYAGGETENDWKMLKEIKNTEEEKVTLNVSAVTDRIRIRVARTSDDTTTPGGRGSQARLKRAPGKIKEIEIYGYAQESPTPTAQAVTVKTETTALGTSTTSPTTGATTESAPVEVPKGPPLSATIEVTQKSFPLSGPIPLKINIKAGADEINTLEDMLSEKMLSTKLIVKSASGNVIACSKPVPPLSSPRPYRSSDKPVDVRNAITIDPNGTLTVNIANLLDYYPINAPDTYTIQLVTWVDLHDKYVGREATEKEDLERQIRDINSKSNYTAQEKAALIQNLKDELLQSQKRKSKRYIEVNAKGKPFKLESNTIEITIQ